MFAQQERLLGSQRIWFQWANSGGTGSPNECFRFYLNAVLGIRQTKHYLNRRNWDCHCVCQCPRKHTLGEVSSNSWMWGGIVWTIFLSDTSVAKQKSPTHVLRKTPVPSRDGTCCRSGAEYFSAWKRCENFRGTKSDVINQNGQRI